jgi:replicative DNA helicase
MENNTDTLPKLDLEFYEKVVIFHCLVDEVYLGSIIDHLDPKYFDNGDIKAIISLTVEFFNTRGTVPTLTELKAYLTTPVLLANFKKVVAIISDFDKKFNKDELYENTERFLKEKAVYNTMLQVADDCSTGNIDTSDILDRFETSCNVNLNLDRGLDYFNDVDRHISDLLQQDSTITTGFKWLDNHLGGGFLEHGRAIYVFAGETNIGKSIFLGNIAANIAEQNKTVLLITLEMSELVYAKRLSTQITQIPINELALQTDYLRSSLNTYNNEHKGARILLKEFPPSTVTCSNIQSFVKKLTQTGVHIDAIVLDYVNLLTTKTGVNSYERIKYVTEKLRALSYIFECPIITATQLNRTGYNEINPGLETVGESYGLAATADCMFSIWQEEEDAELGIIKLGLMKNRFGQNFGSCTLGIDYSTLTLREDAELAQALPDPAAPEDDLLSSSLDFLNDE